MSKYKFKVGDKVKVVNNPNEYYVSCQLERIGQIGTVLQNSHCPYLKFNNAGEDNFYKVPFYEDKLELYVEPIKEKTDKLINGLKFKIGDKVKVVDYIETQRTNEVGVIIDDDDTFHPYKVKFETADGQGDCGEYIEWFKEHDLELVESSSPTNNDQSLEDKIIELIKQEKPNVKSIVINAIITEQAINVSELNYSREF
jgi:hypothetical protein